MKRPKKVEALIQHEIDAGNHVERTDTGWSEPVIVYVMRKPISIEGRALAEDLNFDYHKPQQGTHVSVGEVYAFKAHNIEFPV